MVTLRGSLVGLACAAAWAAAVRPAVARVDWRDAQLEPPRRAATLACTPDPSPPPAQDPTPPDLRYRPLPKAAPIRGAPLLLNEETAAAWLAHDMQERMAEGGIAGAAIVVVKDGRPIYSGHWGHADAKGRHAVDPEGTMFRVASISKAFTWAAIFRLRDRGLLDLDADARLYVSAFPLTRLGPFTLRNLMTHSPGFEDNKWGYLLANHAADLDGLTPTLAAHIPRQVHDAVATFGDARDAAYSNWGAGLAGQIITEKTGRSFDDAMRAEVLDPLDMHHATFEEPDPPGPEWAEGVELEDGRWVARGFEYFHDLAPASALSMPAAEMGNFMEMLLDDGRYHGRAFLSESSARLFKARALSPHPHLNGQTLGLMETYVNGRRTIGHAGKTLYFASEMRLVPEARLGIFVAMNSFYPADWVVDDFIAHFFPACDLPALNPPGNLNHLAEYTGWYLPVHRSYTKSEALFSLLSGVERVRATEQGELVYKDERWIEVAPDLFRRARGEETLAFARADGRVSHLLGPTAVYPHDRAGAFDAATLDGLEWLVGILFADAEGDRGPLVRAQASLLLGIVALAWLSGPARWLVLALGLTNFAVAALLTHAVSDSIFAWRGLLVSIPAYLQVESLLSVASLLLCLWLLWRLLRNQGWTPATRGAASLATLLAFLFLFWLERWNLLGWHHL